MKTFTVIVMRPHWFMDAIPCFGTIQDLQYAAITEAKNATHAGQLAQVEALHRDMKDWLRTWIKENDPVTRDGYDLSKLDSSDYTVLGVFAGGVYKPWLNGNFQ